MCPWVLQTCCLCSDIVSTGGGGVFTDRWTLEVVNSRYYSVNAESWSVRTRIQEHSVGTERPSASEQHMDSGSAHSLL